MARILIVDDDEEIAESLRYILEEDGHTVETASSAREGLAMMQRHETPDLVVVDVMLETVAAGIMMVHQIRCGTLTSNIPLIMLSGVNRGFPALHLGQRDLDEGWVPAQRFIEKPYVPDEICQTVHELLSAKQEQT